MLQVIRLISMALVLAGVLIGLAACGTAQVSRADKLATAGIAYADAVPAVLDHAFETAVAVDTLVLRETREALAQDARLDGIEKSNANLAARYDILRGLKDHATGLRQYFVALKVLATSDESPGIAEAARNVAGSLGSISSRIRELSVGKLPLNDFVSQAVPIAVTQFQAAALTRELRARATVIERELDLQQAALSAVAAAMRSDLEAQFAAQDRDNIVLPYVRAGALPGNWEQRRLEAFRRRVQLDVVDAAARAAKNLRLSFIAVAENRVDEGTISLLVDDIAKVVTLVESVRGRRTEG